MVIKIRRVIIREGYYLGRAKGSLWGPKNVLYLDLSGDHTKYTYANIHQNVHLTMVQ